MAPLTHQATPVRQPGAAAQAARISAIVNAKSPSLAAAFYQQVLRLEQAESDTTHILLSRGSVEIAVVQIPADIAAQFTVTTPPVLRAETPVKLSFLVDAFASVRAVAEQTGGGLRSDDAAWTWRAHRHLDGHDPEGNVVQFRVADTGLPA